MLQHPKSDSLLLQLQQTNEKLRKEVNLLRNHIELVENEMMESELRFFQLSKASFEGVAGIENDGIILCNDALCEMFGYDQFEIAKISIRDLIAPQNRDYVFDEIDAGGDTIESMGLHKNGNTFPIKIRVKSIPHEGRQAKVIVVRDITQNKKVLRELEESEMRYRKLFRQSQDAIYISNLRGQLLEVNKAALDLFGYEREEMLRMTAMRLYANPEDRERFRRTIAINGSVKNYEVKLLNKEGKTMDCVLSATVRKNTEGEVVGYQGIVRDVTELRRTQSLIKAKELAERSAHLKEKFLANMSHEIRTPMNAVIGLSNLLRNSEMNEQQQKYADGIQTASEHLLVLINDILDFSKIEAGKLEIELVDFDIGQVLHNVYQTFKLKAAEKNLELLLDMESDMPTQLKGDPTRLMQILLNLVSNAVKFTESGNVEIKAKVFAEDRKTATLAFSVTDTGIGIPQEKLENIFNSFEQVSSNTTRKFGGTGLGLAITKKLVEMQGGTISVKSKKGEGSSFIFVLKFTKSEKDAQQYQKNNQIWDKQPLNNLNILLVEDNKLNQVVAVDTIKTWGNNINIDVANNGKEGVEMAQQKPYDLVLMDVQMPEMNGYNATRFIREQLELKDLPILAMTAYATSGEAEKTIMAGMNDYISKPFNPNKLYRKIASLTRRGIKKTHDAEVEVSETDKRETSGNVSENADKQAPKAERNEYNLIDLHFLNEAVMGNESLKVDMIEIMLQETPDELGKLVQFCEDKNWKRLGAMAHKFKSAAQYMGLKDMVELIKHIQHYAEEESHVHDLPDMVQKVNDTCKLACKELEIELKKLKAKNT